MLAVLAQIDGFDPVAGAAVSLTASSIDDPSVCLLNGTIWWPALSKLPTLRYDLFDGAFAAQISAPSSSLTMATEAWPNFGRYELADARIRLWTGNVGDAWGAYTLRFDGRVSSQPTLKDFSAQLDFAVDDRWLDTALLATYAGTAGAEGPATLKGQPKPLALGAPRYVSGTLVDSINSVFQVSGYGPVNGFEAALERLGRFNAPIGDFASYAALVAATIPAGAWATANAVGLARFGAPPSGQISFLLQGDAAGTDGWARKTGQIIRRIAILSGGAGKINDASLNALDALRPYNVSINIDQQTTARDVIQKLAAAVNAVAGVSWLGQLFVVPVAIGAPSVTLAADGSALPAVSSVEQIAIDAPWQKLALTAERTWTVHQLADIAFTATLVDLGPFDATTVYREGNIVQQQGVSWLRGSAPASSDAPPPLPAASNTWWKLLSGAGTQVYNSAVAPASPRDGDIWAPPGSGILYRYTDGGTPLYVPISDITALNQVSVSLVTDITINADSSGTIAAGVLPAVAAPPRVTLGGTDISTLDETQYALQNGTGGCSGNVSIDTANGSATKGVVTIGTGFNATGTYELVVTVGGVAQAPVKVTVTKKLAAASGGGAGGGGSGGGGGGSGGGSSGSGATNFDGAALASTSPTVIATITGIAVDGTQTLLASASGDYDVQYSSSAASNTVNGKLRYAPTGTTSWVDFAGYNAGTLARFDPRGISTATGNYSSGRKSAMPAAGSYDIQLVCYGANANPVLFSNSGMSANASSATGGTA